MLDDFSIIGPDNWIRFFSAAAVILGTYIIYVLFASPVAHIPGPWWARFTKAPLLYATFKGHRAAFAQDLLDHYGPIVVIAPNQVHTSDEKALNAIYARTSIKTSFYANMGSWKGVTSTLGILDYPTASTTRNNLIQCFQNRNLETLSDSISGHVEQLVSVMQRRATGAELVDGIFWYRLLALDIVTDVLWGEQTDLVKSADAGQTETAFLRRFHAFSKYNALRSFIPGLDTFVRLFGPPTWTQLRNDLGDLDETANAALERWENGSSKRHDKDVLSMLAKLNDHSDPSKRIPNSHIPAYLVEMLAAGSSTTAATATLCTHELSFSHERQTRLRTELFEAFPDPSRIDLNVAQTLPYLKACVKETMRLYPVIPGPLERWIVTPFYVNGYKVGPRVIASSSAFTQGRLSEVYEDAERWKPERWLTEDGDKLARMNHNWIPFGSGSRACPGSNLALNELHLILAGVFRRLRAMPPTNHPQSELEFVDHFTLSPVGGKVWHMFASAADTVE